MLTYLLTLIDNEDDRKRFQSIYNQHHIPMEKAALRILTEQKDAEDAMQNAWVQVIKHFEKIPEIPCDQLLYWLISIVKNECLMLLRKKRKTVPLDDWDEPTVAADSNLNYKELVSLFAKLPETYRAALEMKFLLQYTDREIAQHLRISETAVSSRIHRGRSLLRQLVEKEGFTYGRKS